MRISAQYTIAHKDKEKKLNLQINEIIFLRFQVNHFANHIELFNSLA